MIYEFLECIHLSKSEYRVFINFFAELELNDTLTSYIDFFAVSKSDITVKIAPQASTNTTMHAYKFQKNHHQHKNEG